MRSLLVAKHYLPQWLWNHLDVLSIPRWHKWFMDPLFSITDLFFFSLLLNFHIWPLNFQNTFQLFFFRFDPYCFNYYFLFTIIYKIRIIFQFHPPSNFFHQSNLVLILLITIYFIWDHFKNWFFCMISSPFSFFLSDLILFITFFFLETF